MTPLDPRARLAAAFVLLLVVAASVTVLLNRSDHRGAALPPTPPSPVTTTAASRPAAPSRTGATSTRTTCRPAGKSPFGGTAPVRICIPAIHVQATVMQLGLNADRTVQVPPLSRVGDAGWYKYSAAPGVSGPTVILGHVDSAVYGEGVFFRLGQLRSGDPVSVDRGDGRIATYLINRVDEVPKRNFPSLAVYGPTSGPAIRLVTCGGRFDTATMNYMDNIIAYGTLQSISAN